METFILETPDELIDLLTSWALDFCPADAVNRYDEAGLEAHLRKVLLPRLIAAEASLAESQARAERAEGQVAELEAAEQRRSEAARQHLDWHGKNIDEAYKSYE